MKVMSSQMNIKQWSIYLVDLHPKAGTKPGKIRPCLCIRPDYFSSLPSSVILPFTSRLPLNSQSSFPVRLRVPSGIAGLDVESDLLIDQILSWDNRKFISELGELPIAYRGDVKFYLKEFLDL